MGRRSALGQVSRQAAIEVLTSLKWKTYNLEIGKIMHKIHSGNPPDNFKQLFTPLNQIHSYETRSATRGAFCWQAASNKYGKRSLKHLGPKI